VNTDTFTREQVRELGEPLIKQLNEKASQWARGGFAPTQVTTPPPSTTGHGHAHS
jgi:hypothetical protein